MADSKLNQRRKQIDDVDYKLIDNLFLRQQIISEIVLLKKDESSIEDKNREIQMLNDRCKLAKERGISDEFTKQLFTLILDESKRFQKQMIKKKKT